MTDRDAEDLVGQVIHAFSESGFYIDVKPGQGGYGPLADYGSLATKIKVIAG